MKYVVFLFIVLLFAPSNAPAASCCVSFSGCQVQTRTSCTSPQEQVVCSVVSGCPAPGAKDPTTGEAGNGSCCATPGTCGPKPDSGGCASGQIEVECGTFQACMASTPDAAPTAPVPLLVPRLSVNIPTLSVPEFLDVKTEGGFAYIPFIAVYLAGIYKYGVAAAAVLAVIVIMIGGFRWILAGGGPAVSEAKKMISNAIIGLFIAVGSYVVLATVNPELVQFKYLKIPIVAGVRLTQGDVYDKNPEDQNVSANLSKTELDNVFKAYASCYGMDYRVLKAIAAAESGIDPSKQTPSGKYQGLFQESDSYCQENIGGYPFLNCSNRFDAEANTAAAATKINSNLKSIIGKCPQSTLDDQILLLYVAHNNGPAVMNYVVNAGACDSGSQRAKVREFYDTCGGKSKDCNGTFRGVNADTGEKKWRYGQRVVNNVQSLGATTAYPPEAKNNAQCPKVTGKRVGP